jgi:hypothetical protein
MGDLFMMILGVYREKMFSPGRVEDDARILEATLRELALSGHTVRAVRPEDLEAEPPAVGCVVTMAASPRILALLERLERLGTRIVNGVEAIRNCQRTSLFRLLAGAGLPIPKGWVVPVELLRTCISFKGGRSYWLKRGDFHCVGPGDVVRVSTWGEVTRAFGHFKGNGIKDVVVEEHVEGEVVKFYGVADDSFFGAFVLARDREDVTHRSGCLRTLAAEAARVLGLEVFGGDAVITPEGHTFLIDVNGWPSFACCRQSAARGIASYVSGLAEERLERLSAPY